MKLANKIMLWIWVLILAVSIIFINILKLSPFLYYDLTFLIIFAAVVTFFLYRKRKNLKREGITYLYRTSLGLKVIDKISRRHPRFMNFLSYFIIIFGYAAMAAMLYLLGKTIQIFITSQEFVRFVKIPPLAPLIPYLPQIFHADYLPMFYFTYWIVVIAVVGIVHEFSHGIFARLYNIKVKSTGFAFFGPFIGAFVEPDEKQMSKAKKKQQLAILAAGTFSNAVLCIIFFLMLWLFFAALYSQSGVVFDTYDYGFINSSSINRIGNNISISFIAGNLTEVKSGNSTYFIPSEIIQQISNSSMIFAYGDSPALKAGLSGAISEVNGIAIMNTAELKKEIMKYSPGETIEIIAIDISTGEKNNYTLKLEKNPQNESIPYLGIATLQQQMSILGKVRNFFMFFRDENVYYAPKFSPKITEFIYYLIWWLAFINLSVALANMLPAWIFDGGRFFYLSALAIVKKERIAKKILKIMNYLILAAFLLLMALWAYAFFLA